MVILTADERILIALYLLIYLYEFVRISWLRSNDDASGVPAAKPWAFAAFARLYTFLKANGAI